MDSSVRADKKSKAHSKKFQYHHLLAYQDALSI